MKCHVCVNVDPGRVPLSIVVYICADLVIRPINTPPLVLVVDENVRPLLPPLHLVVVDALQV